MSISSSGLNFEDTIIDGQEGNVECSSSQIEDKNVSLSLTFLVQTVGNSSSSWLVNNSQDINSSNASGILCCLSLAVIEISRDSDDCVFNGLSNKSFSSFLHLGQDHWGDFFRVELFDLSFVLNSNDWLIVSSWFNFEGPKFAILLDDRVIKLSTDKSLGIKDGIDRVLRSLILSCVSDESFSLCESDVRWGGSVSLIVGDDFNSFVLPDAYTRVGCSEINTNGFAYWFFFSHSLNFCYISIMKLNIRKNKMF